MINEIRIFPMSAKDPDASTLSRLEYYLTDKLPNGQDGKFYYPNKPGMKFSGGEVLVLFQYNGTVRGCGILVGLEEEPKIEFNKSYKGYFQFKPESLKYFKIPITKDELSLISPKFKKFGQSKQKLEIEILDDLEKLIKKHS